ncbi:MAG: FAD-binding protein [Eubacteriales bacterium]|nr:FAD-binding protein [Eubacteriales bacterium]
MLRLHQLVLTPDDALAFDEAALRRLCAQRLRVAEARIAHVRLVKRSVDARGHGGVRFSLTADVTLDGADEREEARVAQRFKPNQVAVVAGHPAAATPDVFSLSLPPWPAGRPRPVVVGAGPAGLFCALALAARGARPILLERGRPVEERARDVEALEQTGLLLAESNVLFGEGGAGAFSDGKLTCGLNSPHIRTVLGTLVRCGAPEEILTAQRPHIGTDELRRVLAQIRRRLTDLGGEARFGARLTGLAIKDGRVRAARIAANGQEDEIACDTVCLAIGHSARDTYEWLSALGLPMQPKPFAIGVRIEHLQREIDRAQYGPWAGHAALPPAEYKLNVPTPDGRGVYTFCMCPGGQVINASSEAGGINVNGMSLHARNGRNANAAVLVGVSPKDFGGEHPLAGMELQRRIERAAYACSGSLKAPCQRVGDLLAGRATARLGGVAPTYRPGVILGDMRGFLPDFVIQNLCLALPKLGQRLKGFDCPDALLTGPETRSSAPVRILRNARRESPVAGLYPLGEGAGYAGGIVSAAVDGLCAGMEILCGD